MRKDLLRVVVWSLLVALVIPVGAADPCFKKKKKKSSDEEKTLVIFSTNDMHGRINNFAKIKTLVDAERAQNDNVLVLSAGDKYTGNPIVDQHPDKGYPMVELMNRIGYQYEPFGNHEFDLGQDVMMRRRHQALFESISANTAMDPTLTAVEQARPYALFDLNGTRVCILGLSQATQQDNGSWRPGAHPQKIVGVTFSDPIAAALGYRTLRDSCDVFIALTHIGYEEDLKLAEAMPELDAIIGGHSHTRIDSLTIVNGVLIAQTQCWLQYLGKTSLTLKGGKVVDHHYELINLSKPIDEDPEVKALIDEFTTNSPLNVPIATATEQFNGKEALSTMMTDALIGMLDVDIALQNSGGVRIGQLPKGAISQTDIFTLNPFCNNVYIYDMTIADLSEMLLNSYRPASRRADLLPGGIKYTLFTRDGKATRVEITDMDGKPLDENRTYRVAMNSYVATSYTFPGSDKGTELMQNDTELLIKWLQKVKTVTPHPARTKVEESN